MTNDILLIATSVCLLLIISIGFILFMVAYQKKRIGLIKAKIEAEQEVKESGLRNKIEQLQSLNRERERISADLHDEMGASLSSIKLMAELLKRNMTTEKEKLELDEIIDSCSSLNGSMREMIWSLNSKNDTLQNFCLYIKQYALKFFQPTAIEFSMSFIEFPMDIHLQSDLRRNLFLILKEILNNIVKHAKASEVTVNCKLVNHKLHFTLFDNGVGIADNVSFGNGIHNIQKRLAQFDGRFQYQNTNNGFSQEIEVPLPKSN